MKNGTEVRGGGGDSVGRGVEMKRNRGGGGERKRGGGENDKGRKEWWRDKQQTYRQTEKQTADRQADRQTDSR